MTKQRMPEVKAVLFEELLSCRGKVFLICLGFSKNPVDAEELAQEVYLRAYENLSSLKDRSLAKAWLFRIAKNICLDHIKKSRSKPLAIRRGIDLRENRTPEMVVDDQEQIRILKKMITRLPKKPREVFILRAYGELTYEEIARTLGINIGTVMSRLSRARRSISSRMRGEEP